MPAARHVVVIGAGLGGMACAALLAKRGYRVTVVERDAHVGGKMGRYVHGGLTFDTGPSLLTMPFVLEHFFAAMGTRMQDHLELVRVDPACHYRWPDGTTLNLPFDLSDVPDAIATVSAVDGPNVRRYLQRAQRLYELTKQIFLFSPFAGFFELLRPRNLFLWPQLPALQAHRTLHEVHRRTFSDPRIVQLFDRFATYNGSNPYRAPATLMVIPWVEFGYGAWYPLGGMYRIAEAMYDVCKGAGVRVYTGIGASAIRIRTGRRADGVELEDGTYIAADHVVSNADVYLTRKHLLGENVPKPPDPSHAALIDFLRVQQAPEGLAHHNVLFSSDYEQEFVEIDAGRIPADHTVYVSRSCATDATQTTGNQENWFVLRIQAGEFGGADRNSKEVPPADAVLRKHNQAFANLSVECFSSRYSREPLYGRASNTILSAFLRQRQRSRTHTNLWYVGGSAHPGGGIPLVVLSGMMAANLITAKH